MDAITNLQQQFVEYATSLYAEGILDNQFTELQKLQDESNPDFVVEVVSLFFEDSEKLLNNLNTALQQQIVDYKQVDAHVHQFKGSSSSIGAQRVKDVCVYFRNFCEEKNLEGQQGVQKNWESFSSLFIEDDADTRDWVVSVLAGCKICLHQLNSEYHQVKGKLEHLFRMEQQILAAGGSIPMLS